MECRQVDRMINEHSLDKLSAAAKAELDAHVDQCGRCADVLMSHRLLRSETPASPREGFFEQARAAVIGRLDAEAEARSARRLAPALGLAASALLAAVIVGLVLPGDQSGSPIIDPGPVADLPPDAAGGTPRMPQPDSTTLGNTPGAFAPAIPGFLGGIHYENLPEPVPTTTGDEKVEVCEFFMFICIHCYNLEPELAAWAGRQGDALELVRVPAIWHAVSRLHAQAYYTAEALGRRDAIVAPFYAEIHERGNPLETRAAVRAFFGRQGIDGASFDRTFDSPDVLERVARAEELNRLYRVDSTPSIGVNGRYLTTTGMAGSTERLFDLVDALVEAEARAQAETRACAGVDADAEPEAAQQCRMRMLLRQGQPSMPRVPF